MRGIVLYGPPAAGKNTVTQALHDLDDNYVLFPLLKFGSGRTVGYRITTESTIANLRATGEVIWEHARYNATYLVDRAALNDRLTKHIPVLHFGHSEAIGAIIKATPDVRWLIIYLWCPRDIAERRIVDRGTGDVAERLSAWDETTPLQHAHITINTAETTPGAAAHEIHTLNSKRVVLTLTTAANQKLA
jgi:guanylate kinase